MASADVVIVGGGIIGLSTAWKLSAAGLTVTVVDPNPGRGASFAAAGMLAPVTEAAYGEESLLALNRVSQLQWPAFAAALEQASGLRVGLELAGTLFVGRDPSDRSELEELLAFQRQLGLEVSWCPPSKARELEPLLAGELSGGLLAPMEYQVDNRRVLAALGVALGRAGVTVVRDRMAGLEALADGHRVYAGMAEIDCHTVVLAAGHETATLPGIPDEIRPRIRPVKGQILRLFARDPRLRLQRTVRARVSGHSVYAVPRADGRVVIGATTEEQGTDFTVTAGATYELLRDATRILPVIHEYELREVRVGLRPASVDNAPLIGETTRPGIVLATGHYRNGVLLAPITAAAVTALITTGDVGPDVAPFGPSRAKPNDDADPSTVAGEAGGAR
jgi:glycine oxidase